MGGGGFVFYFIAMFCKTCSVYFSQESVECKCHVVYFKMLPVTQEMSCLFSLSPPKDK